MEISLGMSIFTLAHKVAVVVNGNKTFIIQTASDVRECWLEDGYFIHVLNSGFRMKEDDPRIISVKEVTPACNKENGDE